MTESSPQFVCRELSDRGSLGDGLALTVVVHASLAPKRVAAWRMRADTELRVHGTDVWLTREGRLDDYWLRIGDVVRLTRGDRIWLSADGGAAAQLTFASHYIDRRGGFQRWLGR